MGSYGTGGWPHFHWKTILLPARIAEYVVVQEMAHAHEFHSAPETGRRAARAMEDSERGKACLASQGAEVEVFGSGDLCRFGEFDAAQ